MKSCLPLTRTADIHHTMKAKGLGKIAEQFIMCLEHVGDDVKNEDLRFAKGSNYYPAHISELWRQGIRYVRAMKWQKR
jgi:hypothetical protein